MTKEQAVTYLHNHIDVLYVVLAGVGGIGGLLTIANQFVGLLVGLTSLGFISYKWWRLYHKK